MKAALSEVSFPAGTSLINFHLNCQASCGNALDELRSTSLYDFPDRRLGSVAGLRDITTTATIDPSPKKEKNERTKARSSLAIHS